MSDSTPPKKTVRFALEDSEPSTPTPKKTVRFALDNDVVGPSTPNLDLVVESSAPSKLDIAQPQTPPSISQAFSNASQTSTSSTSTRPTRSALSPTEIRTWSEDVSSSAAAAPTLAFTVFPPETPTQTCPHPVLHHSYSDDRGEKDSAGRVVEASAEPCEKCGGKIVWATRGEWLMICGECQEPQ